MKKILGVYTSPRPHWVGDGFPVRTLFSHDSLGKHVSPFLLLDFASLMFHPRSPAQGSRRASAPRFREGDRPAVVASAGWLTDGRFRPGCWLV
ncbi:pirin [Pseudomonas sp. BAY1663]|nr:pirin [Pseudomonas sp. BAY1663]